MGLVIQDEGLLRKMNALASDWNATQLKIHLYSNNYTPNQSTVLADLTENSFPGYSAQNITTWGAASVASHVAQIAAAANTFTRSSTGTSQNIYGYYVTNAASDKLYWVERDPSAPRVVTNAGDSVTITPQHTDQSLNT